MFKAAEKPFRRAINPVCAFSTQILSHFHNRQMLSVFMAGSLAIPIRVMEQARFRLSAPKGHLQGTGTQRDPHVIGNRPANDLLREQINDDHDIEPAFQCPDVSDISRPDLIPILINFHINKAHCRVRRFRMVSGWRRTDCLRGNTRQRSGHSQQSIGLPSRIAVAAARLVRRGSVLVNGEAEAGWKDSPVLAALRPYARPPDPQPICRACRV
jgi:hypothetical protein